MHPRPFLFVASFLAVTACNRPAPEPEPPAPAPPGDPPGVHNLHAVGDGLWSGSNPEGDAGFQSLRDLGVKTVVSVDGARPDVERARAFGLRYIHVPVGYGGISREQALQLAKANDLPGPIYVHCHHGKHRGPTAAALMRLGRADGWSPEDAHRFLATAGTDPKYEGLYANAREFRRPTADELKSVGVPPESATVVGLTAIMVEVDDAWDRLKNIKDNEWKVPVGVGGSAAHPAVQLEEHYREAARLPESAGRPEAFRIMLADGESAAKDLEVALRVGDGVAAGVAFDRSAKLCAVCHRDYRDTKR